jgi:hypothetical protein
MHKIHGRTIEDATVELDNGDWENCKFIRCRLVYQGGALRWSNNVFEGCDLALAGPASMGHKLGQLLPRATTEQFAPYRTASEIENG